MDLVGLVADRFHVPPELEATAERIRELEREIEAQEIEFRRVFHRDRTPPSSSAADDAGPSDSDEHGAEE